VVVVGTDRGVFHSDDAGITWLPAFGITHSVSALASSAQLPGAYLAASDGRVWLSRDWGHHWATFGRPLSGHLSITALALLPSPASVVAVFAATDQGLWQITAAGLTRVAHLSPGHAVTGVAADSAHVVAVASDDTALYTSTDAGATWYRKPIAGLSSGITTMLQDPQQTSTLLLGDQDGGVLVSQDGGTTWNIPGATVAGTIGSPILALALVRRPPLPVDGVPNSHQPGVTWFSEDGGHTIREPFQAFWLSVGQSAAIVLGYPLTEQFYDRDRGGARAQYFDNAELVVQNNRVLLAPLGAEAAPAPYTGGKTTYSVAAPFQSIVSQNGMSALFGPAVSPDLQMITDDGTGRLYLVQYFRNVRLEYHPEAGGAGPSVKISPLGQLALQAKGWLP
jgi:hypothetical protein